MQMMIHNYNIIILLTVQIMPIIVQHKLTNRILQDVRAQNHQSSAIQGTSRANFYITINSFGSVATATVFQLIVDQTNLYASQCLEPDKYNDWQQLTIPELKAYIGFMILIGIVRLPLIYDYWKKKRSIQFQTDSKQDF